MTSVARSCCYWWLGPLGRRFGRGCCGSGRMRDGVPRKLGLRRGAGSVTLVLSCGIPPPASLRRPPPPPTQEVLPFPLSEKVFLVSLARRCSGVRDKRPGAISVPSLLQRTHNAQNGNCKPQPESTSFLQGHRHILTSPQQQTRPCLHPLFWKRGARGVWGPAGALWRHQGMLPSCAFPSS